ncbi:hypothetical protein [Dyadobacter sp. NIV53]|uniref:hypothetical protein n=1 Tax=Dyadobacter sp. NIV53 TaxID=2861765 RepID=UPI001C86FDFF|nr:hypothetical protein [Dyadobacter sp. NIV53]
MGRKNEQDQFREKLALWLGITYDELEEYGEDVVANDGEHGKDEYVYMIQFSDSTPYEILDKIDRIDRRRTVYFNLEELTEVL